MTLSVSEAFNHCLANLFLIMLSFKWDFGVIFIHSYLLFLELGLFICDP